MQISLRPNSDPGPASTVTLEVEGEVDAHNCGDFAARLMELAQTGLQEAGLQEARLANVVLDMTKVSFIDSSGVSELLRTGKALESGGASLQISEASAPVQRVLELTGLAEHLGLRMSN